MKKIAWLVANKLKLHAEKSKWMLIDREVGDDRNQLAMEMNGQTIERVKQI